MSGRWKVVLQIAGLVGSLAIGVGGHALYAYGQIVRLETLLDAHIKNDAMHMPVVLQDHRTRQIVDDKQAPVLKELEFIREALERIEKKM